MSQALFMKKILLSFSPIIVAVITMLIPAPEGLSPHAWYFFAIFLGCVVGLILEPLPGAAVGFIGVAVIALFANYVLFSPEQLAEPGFKSANKAFEWAVSGFTNSTVWLIFGAFMFALGYEKTGLGRRIALILVKSLGKRSLTLGYAIMIADVALSPFTPSNTARSGGTIYPIISNLPPLYGSKPNDPSMKKIGTFLMWTAIASTCVTSSLFLTALAPNLLGISIATKTTGITITWMEWFYAAAPACILLVIITPFLCYIFCPPEIKSGDAIPEWAATELKKLGGLTAKEVLLLVFVVIALMLWIFADKYVAAALVGMLVISAMLLCKVITWNDILSNKAAWNTFAWFATLVALADGLSKVGFVDWFGGLMGAHINGFSPIMVMVILTVVFYLLHYFFASTTAHATALLPVILGAASHVPGLDMHTFLLILLPTLGLMGIITPYGTGPSPVYYGSGYLPSKLWWMLGLVFGLLFLVVWLVIGVPWVLFIA